MKLDKIKAFLTGLCNPGRQDILYGVTFTLQLSMFVLICSDAQHHTTLQEDQLLASLQLYMLQHLLTCTTQISSTVDMLINLCHT